MPDTVAAVGPPSAGVEDSCQELINLLVSLENNIVLYPPEHESIRKVTDALRQQTEALLTQGKSLVLLAAKDQLLIDGRRLAASNSRNRKLSLLLSQRGIVSVTLEKGLTAQELTRFFELLHELPPKTDVGQYPAVLESLNALPHIRTTQFEANSLRVQNQDQVEAPADSLLRESKLEQILRSGATGTEREELLSALSELFPEFASALQIAAPSGTSDDRPSPDEKSGPDDGPLLERLRQTVSDEMLLAMARRSGNDERRISPALQKLLSSLSQVAGTEPGDPSARRSGVIGTDAISKLFERERYEAFVPSDYGNQLSSLPMTGDVFSGTLTSPRPAPELAEADLREEQLGRWLAMDLVCLLGGSYDDDVLGGCCEQLGNMLPEFIERKEYDLLRSVCLALGPRPPAAPPPAAPPPPASGGVEPAYIQKLRDQFNDPSFLSQLRSDFLSSTADSGKDLEEVVVCSGSQNIPWLLELYGQSGDERRRARLLRLLLRFGSATAEAVLNGIETLDHKNPKPVLRLITLCGGDPADARLLPLLNAREPEVRLEVIRMGLSVGSPAPVPLLVRMIRSRDEYSSVLAVRIAGEYKVAALAAELAGRIRTGFISASGAYRNRVILESLSRIGDVSVLPRFLKVVRARLSFTPGRLRSLKEMLFLNLSGYPVDALAELLDAGTNSRNPDIRRSAQQYGGADNREMP